MSITKLSAFLARYTTFRQYCIYHWCPACKELHPFAVDRPFDNGHRWSFNNDLEKPTFQPSMNISSGSAGAGADSYRCHYFLTNGKIQYLGDSTHELAGQTIDLPPIPEEILKPKPEPLD